MPLQLPTTQSLLVFEGLSRERTLARAATELGMSPSAVAYHIHSLEHCLGDQIFTRSNDGFSLTPFGENILYRARESLELLKGIVQEKDRRRTLRISCPPSLGTTWLMPRLTLFNVLRPDVDVILEMDGYSSGIPIRNVDIAIQVSGESTWSELRFHLFDEWIVPVASPAYIDAHALIEPRDLRNALLLRTGRTPWKPWFDVAGLDWSEPVTGHLFDNAYTVAEAAAAGLGVALARKLIATPLLVSGKLRELFPIRQKAPFTYQLLCRVAPHTNSIVRDFVSWIKLEAKKTTSTIKSTI